MIIGRVTRVRSDLDADTEGDHTTPDGGLSIVSYGVRRKPGSWRGRFLAPLVLALLFVLTLPAASQAGTFAFPVQSEQVVTGTTSGLGGAQADDGSREVLSEGDTAPDPVTTPSSGTPTIGTVVGGSFPSGIAADDGSLLQYREVWPPSSVHYPTAQAFTSGTACGGTFPTDLESSNNTYVCLAEAGVLTSTEVGAVGYRSGSGGGANLPKQLDWTGTAWGTPETELATAGAAVENVRTVWDIGAGSTLFWIALNTGPNVHVYRCTNVDTCTKEDVDPGSGNDFAVTQAVGAIPERHWDLAIEQMSGELLLAYDNPAAVVNDICYRTRTAGAAGTWSSEACVNHSAIATTNPSLAYLTLVANPGTNRIGFGGFDTTNDDFVVAVWDGSAWVNADKAVSTAVTLTSGWGGTVAVEDSANEFVAYAGNGANSIVECEWTSVAGWEAGCATFGPWTDALNDVRTMVNDFLPGSDKSLVCAGGDRADQTCWRWSGVAGTGGARGASFAHTADDGSVGIIAVDSTVTSGIVTGAVPSITVSHTTGSGTNRLMLIGVTVTNDGAGGGRVLNSVTWNGVSLTQVTTVSTIDDARVWIYRLINPAPATTANAVATFDGNVASIGGITMGVITFSGVDQATPLGTPVTESEGDGSITVTAANDEWIFDTISLEQGSLTVGADQTQRWNRASGSNVRGGASTQLGSANDVMSWSHGTSRHRAHAGVAIRRAVAAIDIRADVAWNPDQAGTADALAVFYGNTTGTLGYNTFDDGAGSWGTASTFPSAGAHKWINLARTPTAGNTNKVHVLVSNSNFDVLAYRWTGSGAPGSEATITADTVDENYAYWDLAFQASPGSGYVLSVRHDWTGIPTDGAAYDLCVEAYVSDGAESMVVEVLTPPATWSPRITVTNSTDDVDLCSALTPAEFNAGAPSTRWVGGTETGDAMQSYVNIDQEWIIRQFTGYRLDLSYNWTGVPAGASHVLIVKGFRSDENVTVQVLTPPATWTTRFTVNAPTSTLFTYTFAPSEYNGGNPRVRFVDAVITGDASASDLSLDWVAITSIRLSFAAEVRQNVTGIIAGTAPTLVVKGNISAGGENFHVYVWDFPAATWSLLLSAPFTATNAYHNASLAAAHLSGGTVRVRFVDAGAQNATRWALSLDYVAVVITNGQAVLSNGGVAPASGYLSTNFTFFVRYTDPENNTPAFVRLVLPPVPYSMSENNSLDTNYADGKDYFVSQTIGVRGTFDYYFTTAASAGDTTVTSTAVRQVSVLNRAPTITNPVAVDGVHVGQLYVQDFNASDLDGDGVAWSMSTSAAWLSIGPTNGTVWGQAPATNGSFAVNTSVSDGLGGSSWNTYSLNVGNLRPNITAIAGTFTSFRRAAFAVDLNAVDPDGDSLLWSLRTNATFLAINPVTGIVSGLAASVPSTFWFEATVADAFGGVDRRNLTLVVVNQAPQISGPPPPTAEEGTAYSGQVSATDPDADSLSWSLETNATWLTLDSASGALSGSPIAGVYFVNVTVQDSYGGVSYQNTTLVVLPPPSLGAGVVPPWTILILGATAMLIALLFVAQQRRRPVVEQAFLLDDDGEVRFVFAGTDGPFDEAKVRSLLSSRPGNSGSLLFEPPYFLHIVPRRAGLWAVVSRVRNAARVRRAARTLFARAETDLAIGSAIEAPEETA